MNSRILKLWRDHPFALATEIGVFLAFALSLYIMANLETIVSTWAMLPHVLCNGVVVALIVRHRVLGRPAMYWNHFDIVVLLLFLYFMANVYYSEIRAISWQTAALYMDSLAAYFMGRMMFYHRVRAYALILTGALLFSWFGLQVNAYQARQQEKTYHEQATQLEAAPPADMTPDEAQRSADDLYSKAKFQDSVAMRYEPIKTAYLLLMAFWALSLVFLWLEKPSALAFLVYTCGVLGLYVFYALGKMAWMLTDGDTIEGVLERTARFESLRTAMSILNNYPVTGGGLGTFPALFDAYRLTPAAPYGTGFNSYVYSAVETGFVGALLFLYFLVRLPLHALRRWKMMPHHRLRFAILVHLVFLCLFLVQGFHDSGMFQPAVWFPVWAIIGTAVSLIVVRDPIRVFESLVPIGRAHDPDAIQRKVTYSGKEGGFGRTPLAKLPRQRVPFLRRMGIIQMMFIMLLALAFFVFTCLEALPYVGRKMATPDSADKTNLTTVARKAELGSEDYGNRLLRATRVFPLDSYTWTFLASHYEARIGEPLEIYQYSDRIEKAYTTAVKLNPYRPDVYEKLYFLYRDINRQGDSLDIIKQGVQNNPNQLVLRLLLIRELERMGDYPLATHHVKQSVLRIAPGETELYLRLAELYELQGQTSDAKHYYLYAKQVVPDNPQTKARLQRLKERLAL